MNINANGTQIRIIKSNDYTNSYLSLTDIARKKNPHEPKDVVKNWMRIRSTIDFLGLWEQLNNPNFKGVEFDSFRAEAGTNAFTLTPQRWIDKTNAIGIISKSGNGGGTYAHSDIAFEFASWISPEFKLYIIKDYQRLKKDEAQRLAIGWDTKRELAKINYRIHTDAIKDFLITPELTPSEQKSAYANEADLLNVALFGKTAKEWQMETGRSKTENQRDYASVEQLIVLVNLESMNADMIRQGLSPLERLSKLRKVAYYQLKSLSNGTAKRLKASIEHKLLE